MPPAAELMVDVPAGRYTVGCKPPSKGCLEDERPSQAVEIERFALMRDEVTVGLYAICVAAGKCGTPKSGEGCNWGSALRDRHPVNCVAWQQAKEFCEAYGWRLPSEAQWEVAARGPQLFDYPWGAEEPSCDRTVMASSSGGCGTGGTRPVGSVAADRSWIGAVDLGGNVREWTATQYAAYPGGTMVAGAHGKVTRGGGWLMHAGQPVSSHARAATAPDDARADLGFRCALAR